MNLGQCVQCNGDNQESHEIPYKTSLECLVLPPVIPNIFFTSLACQGREPQLTGHSTTIS